MSDQISAKSNLVFMLLSAGIFAWFGFGTQWNYKGVNGEFLFFVALLDWTLKGSAVAFGVAAITTLLNAWLGNVLYSGFGLLSAICLLVAGVLDLLDTQHVAMSPLLLFLFAAWNGYGSWQGLQEAIASNPARSSHAQFMP